MDTNRNGVRKNALWVQTTPSVNNFTFLPPTIVIDNFPFSHEKFCLLSKALTVKHNKMFNLLEGSFHISNECL